MNNKKTVLQHESNNLTQTIELPTNTTVAAAAATTSATVMMTTNVTTTSTSTTSSTKEKEKKGGWFHSLTRRKKTPSQSSINYTNSSTPTSRESNDFMIMTTNPTNSFLQQTNNNNEPLMRSCNAGFTANDHLTSADVPSCSSNSAGTRKRKDEKNVFQRLRKRMGLRFSSLRRHKHSSLDEGGATTDATYEFLTHSPQHEPLHFNFKRSSSSNCGTAGLSTDDNDMIPFTNDFKRFIRKKWLEREDGQNLIMYEASSEMLNQVWYWGEISRRDAQKQLSDKPTGSFLVRDSETSGCQFTLSFRIINVTLHYRLEYRNDYWHFEELQYESIVEMIEDILYRCTNDNFVCFVKVPNEMQPPFPVILKYPLSRYLNMPKLQDLCRRAIQRSTKPEDIAKMSIPPGLQEYLAESRELVF
ncbi:myosin-G heavy chain [Lucilia cuprina]|uniref:myosin-G heavy chain n=1 Tax=Lucilia cuprina TaxID=7375 RepID=UPI001F056526|nr:myosin-G heavy chain [Lucilia cuprina]